MPGLSINDVNRWFGVCIPVWNRGEFRFVYKVNWSWVEELKRIGGSANEYSIVNCFQKFISLIFETTKLGTTVGASSMSLS